MQPGLARKMRRCASTAGILLAIATPSLLTACKGEKVPTAPEVRPVRVITVDRQSAPETVAITGTVQARSEVRMSFRIDGRMIERGVSVGDKIRRGQLVARLDSLNEQSSLQQAQAQLAGATAQQVEARGAYARMRDLVAKNAVSRLQYEQAEALMKTADSAMNAARSQVDLARNRLSYTRLVADAPGVVTAVDAEPGEVVRAGQKIVELATDSGRDAVFDFSAMLKDSMPPDSEFTVSLTIDPKVQATARVREISPRADPVTGTFRVHLRLVDPPGAMRLGSTVTARMNRSAGEGFVIPASALVRTDRKAAVWVVDPKTSTVAMQTVEVKEFAPDWILATGVKPGDVVVTAGVQALRPGQQVRLLEARQ